jgi:hypothetical protein
METSKPLPHSIAESVLGKAAPKERVSAGGVS